MKRGGSEDFQLSDLRYIQTPVGVFFLAHPNPLNLTIVLKYDTIGYLQL